MENPSLVSIVIPTYKRTQMCAETIDHIIKTQTYRPLEFIIVFDGPEDEYWYIQNVFNVHDPILSSFRIVTLGRNWSGIDKFSFGIAPLLVGYLMARGKYVMPWCDDERALTPDHISKMVAAIETPRGFDYDNVKYYPDFVYPKVKIWRNGDPDGPETAIIGEAKPRHGQITHYMFRPENFVKYGYPDWSSHPVDWSLVEKWMSKGADWVFIPEVTFEHRLDQ